MNIRNTQRVISNKERKNDNIKIARKLAMRKLAMRKLAKGMCTVAITGVKLDSVLIQNNDKIYDKK